jgi:hypothetical protein
VLQGPPDGLSLSFELTASRTEATRSSLAVGDRIHRHAALLRPFMSTKSQIELRAMWDQLRTDISLGPEVEAEVDRVFAQADRLSMPFKLNDRPLNARDIYFAYGEGSYFGEDPEAASLLRSLTPAPLPLVEMLFHDVCANYTRVVFVLLEVVRAWGRAYPASHLDPAAQSECIYCLETTGDFQPEEHVIPESLVGDAAVLSGGVCARCNNRLSELDKILIDSEPIAFLRVVHGPLTKKGKFPKARFRDIDFERTAPRALRVTRKNGRPESAPVRQADGSYRFKVTAVGRRPFEPVPLSRALYKVALGILALNEGTDVAMEARYDAARSFILMGTRLPTHLFVRTTGKPHGHIRVTTDPGLPGTPVVIDIYGFTAAFLLEGTAVEGVPSEAPDGLAIFWLGQA